MSYVYSFDVFDTLLTRPFLRPSALFNHIASRLGSGAESAFDSVAYYRARRRAERRARAAARPRDDCSFAEIFAHFDELEAWGLSAATAMATELEAERAHLHPISANISTVRGLLDAGKRVVFISDMYLPGDFIWEMLSMHVAPIGRDTVFVSGDIGLSKHTGRLYQHVLGAEAIPAGALIHVGDNPHADVAVPRRLGIDARPYTDVEPNRFERLPWPRSRAPLWRVGAAGAARAARLAVTRPNGENATVASLACNIVGPVLTAYVAWVLETARSQRLERLYFVSRDGQVFLKIAQALRREGDPECRYLYGSRQAWFLPSVLDPSDESLEWAWLESMSRTGSSILRRLEIDEPAARAVLAAGGFDVGELSKPLYGSDFERFHELLLSAPIADIIRNRAARRRHVVHGYARQEGLFDNVPWAVVDIGWSLRSQRALSRILEAGGRALPVRGFYLGIGARHIPVAEAGLVHAFLSASDSGLSSQARAWWFFRSVLLVEHLFTVADHPTVSGYARRDGCFVPVFKDDNRNPDVVAFARAMHCAVLHYVREISCCPWVDLTGATFRTYALSLMRTFCLRPQAADVAGVAWLPTNRDQSHDERHQSRLASALAFGDLWAMIRYMAGARRTPFFARHFTWLLGSAALSSAPVRALCRSLYALQLITQIRPQLPRKAAQSSTPMACAQSEIEP